jgi:hypothetical protein
MRENHPPAVDSLVGVAVVFGESPKVPNIDAESVVVDGAGEAVGVREVVGVAVVVRVAVGAVVAVGVAVAVAVDDPPKVPNIDPDSVGVAVAVAVAVGVGVAVAVDVGVAVAVGVAVGVRVRWVGGEALPNTERFADGVVGVVAVVLAVRVSFGTVALAPVSAGLLPATRYRLNAPLVWTRLTPGWLSSALMFSRL